MQELRAKYDKKLMRLVEDSRRMAREQQAVPLLSSVKKPDVRTVTKNVSYVYFAIQYHELFEFVSAARLGSLIASLYLCLWPFNFGHTDAFANIRI